MNKDERLLTPNIEADFAPVIGVLNSPKYFHFWCQKVLPLVYDNSLSYYEVLCKLNQLIKELIEDMDKLGNAVEELIEAYKKLEEYVNNYFKNLDLQKEVNIALENMFNKGYFEQYFGQFLKQSVIREQLYYTPFAKVKPNPNLSFDPKWSAQGFCIVHREGGTYMVHAMENEDGFVRLMVFDKADGALVKQRDINGGGHGNDLTYNPDNDRLYMTTYAEATPINSVMEINWDLTVVKSYAFTGTPVYGVSYWNKKYYLRRGLNEVEVYSNGLDGKPSASYNFNYHYRTDTIFQGITVYGGFILIPHGLPVSQTSGRTDNRVPMAQIDVYTVYGNYVRTSFIALEYEIEGIDFDGDEMYIQLNTVYSGCLLRSTLFQNNEVYLSMGDIVSLDPKSVYYTQEYWVSESDNGYFMDGSQQHPIYCFAWLMMFCSLKQKIRLVVNVLSDITRMNIISRSEAFNRITINMNLHNLPFLAVSGDLHVDLNDCYLVGSYSDTGCTVRLDNSARASLNNVGIRVASDYQIYLTNSARASLQDVSFTETAKVYSVYSGFDTELYVTGGSSYNKDALTFKTHLNRFGITSEAIAYFWAYSFIDGLLTTKPFITINKTRTPNLNLDLIRLPGVYSVRRSDIPALTGIPITDATKTISFEIEFIHAGQQKCTYYAYNEDNTKIQKFIGLRKSEHGQPSGFKWLIVGEIPV